MTLSPLVGTGMIMSSTAVGPRVGDAEHCWHRVTVDIGIENADAAPVGCKRLGEVHRD